MMSRIELKAIDTNYCLGHPGYCKRSPTTCMHLQLRDIVSQVTRMIRTQACAETSLHAAACGAAVVH